MQHTFLSTDIRTGAILAEIPMSGGKWSRVLGGTGTFGGNVPLGIPAFSGVDLIRATAPNKTCLYVDRDGELLWGGIIWGRQYDSETNKLTITAVEFFSYFVKRVLAVASSTLFATTGVDAFDMMRAFVTYVQSETGGNLGIVMDAVDSGVLHDRSWEAYEFKEIGEAMTQLSQVIPNFDFEIGVRYDVNHLPQKFLGLYYPRMGRASHLSNAKWEKPGNIRKYSFVEDGTKQAVRTWATGAGEGPSMKTARWTETHVLDEGYPLLEQAVDYKDVSRQTTLDAHAKGDGKAVQYPASLLTMSVDSVAQPVFGEWKEGDDALVSITDDRFPDGIVMNRRIVSWEMGQETTLMAVGTEEAQVATG